MKRMILYIIFIALLAGCGENSDEMATGGMLALKVIKASNFNPAIDHSIIQSYRVSISGQGIDPPIVAEFEGGATEGVIEGVHTGKGRTVTVEATNANGAVIHAGEAFDVKVSGGITEVPVRLESVPIFTNIADGNTIDNTRLVFKVFSDPKNPIAIEERAEDESMALIDASTNSEEIYLDESTGMGRLAPAVMEPGERTFVVKDLITGRLSMAKVLLVDGTGRRPAPTVTAAFSGPGVRACSSPLCAPAVWMNGIW